jgi:hypothetical protein
MSYLVCEVCGKYYELEEGKSSFSYDKCECGGRLSYNDSLKITKNHPPLINNSKKQCTHCGGENPPGSTMCYKCGNEFGVLTQDVNIKKQLKDDKNGISWSGIALGFGFLIISIFMSILALFGTNIPQKPEDIPYNFLIAFGIISIFITIVSGLISSHIGGSSDYKYGIINGGLVGVILGLFLGVASGSILFLVSLAFFGILAVLGGIFGTFLIRRA